MRRLLGSGILALVAVLAPATAGAEWLAKPFGGITFGGSSPYIDLDRVAGKPKVNLGFSVLWLGEVLGIEGEVATTSGFFGDRSKQISHSHLATFGGSAIVALPKRIAEYTLRPYAAVGLGTAQVSFRDKFEVFEYSRFLPTWSLGGGATGFISNTVAVNWDVRLFRTWRSERIGPNTSIVQESKLSFWRATMGFAIRL